MRPSGGIKRKRGSEIAILDLSKAISWKRCKIGSTLVLITNSMLIFVQKLVTLNDLERRNGPYAYFALFHRIPRRTTIMRPTSVSKSTFDSL